VAAIKQINIKTIDN
jgi:serine/threonine protein kinase